MMFDDDIQFLGINNTPRPRASFVNSVTGFALHVEKNGNEPDFRMIFRKVHANAVVVGRKPPQHGSGFYDSNSSKAMFRCPVVSRAHAKFTFSDSGLLYVTDTSSHHGTHIRRPTDLTSKLLPAETLVQVHDGDIVTFGKSVGRNNEIVRPIVARVELLYSTPLLRPPTSITKTTSNSSGRYGLRSSYTSEGDASQSVCSSGNSNDSSSSSSDHSSDHESDVEEISPPAKPPFSSVVPSVNTAFRTLIPTISASTLDVKRGYLPLSSSSLSTTLKRSANEDTDEVMDNPAVHGEDIFDFGSTIDPAEVVADDNFPVDTRAKRPLARMKRRMSANISAKLDRLDDSPRRKSRSRSTSPMDLATPSPSRSSPRIALNKDTTADTSLAASIPSALVPTIFVADPRPFRSPLSPLPPLPPSPPSRLLGRMVQFAQSSSQSAPGLGSFSGEEEPGPAPPSSLSRVIEFAKPFAHDSCLGMDNSSASPSSFVRGHNAADSFSHPAAASEEEESPFAGHAEEEDISPSLYELSYRAPEAVPSPSAQLHHPQDVRNAQGGSGSEVNAESTNIEQPDAGGRLQPFGGAAYVTEDEITEMDERVFDEVHCDDSAIDRESTNMKEPRISVQSTTHNSSSVSSVLQRAGAAFSSFKERFSGSNTEIAGPSNITPAFVDDIASEAREVSEVKIKKLDEELSAVKSDIAALQLRYRKYRNRFNTNVQTLNTKLARLNTLDSGLSSTKDHLDGLDSSLSTAKDEVDWVRSHVDGVRGNIDELRYETDANRMDIDAVRNDFDSLKGEANSLRVDVDSVKDDYITVNGYVAVLQSEFSQLQSESEDMKVELNNMRRDVDDLMGGQNLKENVEDIDDAFHSLRQEWRKWKEDANVDAQTTRTKTQSAIEAACAGGDNISIGEFNKCRDAVNSAEASIKILLDNQEQLFKVIEEQDSGKDMQKQGMTDEFLKLQDQSVAELRALETTRSQAQNELKNVVALRKELEYALAQINSQSHLVHSSLKRKHTDDSEDVGASGLLSGDSASSTVCPNADGLLIPSPKRVRRLARARRIGTVVAQTATVATIGAAAAWAALAFS